MFKLIVFYRNVQAGDKSVVAFTKVFDEDVEKVIVILIKSWIIATSWKTM